MRILMLAQFYPPIIGGEERHVRNLSIDLVRRGHDVTVATLWSPGLEAEAEESGVKIYRLKGSLQRSTSLFRESERRHAPPFPDPELLYKLGQLIRRETPDIVHAHNWLVHSYLPLRQWSGVPLVVTLHDFSLACAKKIAMRSGKVCEGPAFSKCVSCAIQHYGPIKGSVTAMAHWMSSIYERGQVDAFIAVSKAVAAGNRLAKVGVPFEVIPNFVPDAVATLAEPEETVRDLPNDGYMLYVGDINPIKGAHVLLEAYLTLGSDAPPLLLIGRNDSNMPPLPRGVSVYNNWPHSAIMHAWSRCLFAIVPSICADACPTVIMEAMASGKAVIATTLGGSPDLVDHGKTGLLTAPGDKQSLASAMRTLISDPELRQSMARAGFEKAETLKAKAVVPRIERLYERLLSQRIPFAGNEVPNAA
jgi:glycosyltransferase involved in cell wall biosynthesis